MQKKVKMVRFMKILFSLFIILMGTNLQAAPYQYGELFFVEESKHEHSNLQFLGSLLSDNNLIDSYGLTINKSVFSTSLYKLSAEITVRHTELTDSAKSIAQNSTIEQKVNQPTTSFHLVSSLLLLKAKSNILNKFFQDLQLYLDLGLGATQYKEKTFESSNPLSIYGGVTVEVPFEKYSFLAKFRRTSDNFMNSDKFNYNEIQFGMGLKW